MNDPEKKIAKGVFIGLAAFFIGIPLAILLVILAMLILFMVVGAVATAMESWNVWLVIVLAIAWYLYKKNRR